MRLRNAQRAPDPPRAVGTVLAGRLTRRAFIVAAGAVSALTLLEACAPGVTTPTSPSAAASLTPRKGGTLTYAASADIVTLDPTNIGDTVSTNVSTMIFEGLTTYSPDLDLLPALATTWDASGAAWTFKLRQDVKFHDGTPFNAAAVKNVFDRILGPEQTLRKGMWQSILDTVEVVDDATVRFTAKFADPFFPTRVTSNGSAAIFSPAAFARYGKDMATNPVGTGPFMFGEWVKDDHVTVQRFDGYWGGAPYMDKVTVRPVPEAEARMIGLEAGDVQLAIRLNPEHIQRVESNQKLGLLRRKTTRHYYMGLACLKKPYSDVRVRQALNYAIDKQSLVTNIMQGLGTVQGGLLPPGTPSYVDVPGFSYDPAKSKQLLSDAGYPNGFNATFVGPKGVYLKDFELMQALQQQWMAVGVHIELQIVENAKYLELLRMDPQTSPLEMWFDTMAGGGTGADYFLQRFGCAFFRPVGTNTAGACFPNIDDLAGQAQKELDTAKRNDLMKQAQDLLSQQAPAVWLFSIVQLAGTTAKLHDPYFAANESLNANAKTWLEA